MPPHHRSRQAARTRSPRRACLATVAHRRVRFPGSPYTDIESRTARADDEAAACPTSLAQAASPATLGTKSPLHSFIEEFSQHAHRLLILFSREPSLNHRLIKIHEERHKVWGRDEIVRFEQRLEIRGRRRHRTPLLLLFRFALDGADDLLLKCLLTSAALHQCR